jgi:tetratricopeptide (TPR) repeat protein
MRSTRAIGAIFLGIVAAAAAAGPALGDVVHLKDGTRIEGDVHKSADGWRITTAEGTIRHIPAEKVDSIELQGTPDNVEAANGRLASLRRSVEYLDEIPKILERYRQFLAHNDDTPAAALAKADMAIWQGRLDQGLVKYGGQWITPAQRDERAGKAFAATAEARQLLKQGRLKEADALLKKILSADPKNASALYLQGLSQLRQDQLPAARKSFEAVNALVPNHAPTLNNLALILGRQNQTLAAINDYDQAMISSPGNKVILNNVAEAFHGLSKKDQNTPVVKRAAVRFQLQDRDLQQKLAASGWYRWGATWVTKEQLNQLKAAEEKIKTQLDALASDFEAQQQKVAGIDADIDSNNRTMRNIEATSYVQDALGNFYRVAYPPSYYDIQRDTDQLRAKRMKEVVKLDQLRQAARRIQQNLPVPLYTGIQHPIGAEGTPLAAPQQPATQPLTPPATQPAIQAAMPPATQPATRPAKG